MFVLTQENKSIINLAKQRNKSGLGWQNKGMMTGKGMTTEMLQSSFHNIVQFIRTIQNAAVKGCYAAWPRRPLSGSYLLI